MKDNSEYNPLIDKDDTRVVQAAQIVYVDSIPTTQKPTIHEIAQKESDKIRHKTELSNADGMKFVHSEKQASKASQTNAQNYVDVTNAKVKLNHFNQETDLVPKEEETPVGKEYIPDPNFKFQEKTFECQDYKSVDDDPKSMYKETYGNQGEGYKSVYESQTNQGVFEGNKNSDYKSVYES